jgi:hypothetical protein
MIRNFIPRSAKRAVKAAIAILRGPEGTPGLPSGLSIAELNDITNKLFAASIKKVGYRQLSAWKRSGTYRIEVVLEGGSRETLVFRDERYDAEHIPALMGLPALPGRSEQVVYSTADQSVSKFLPISYMAREVECCHHYQYLLEDLSPTHYPLHTGKLNRESILTAVRALVVLQRIGTAAYAGERERLIMYDDSFSRGLVEYAKKNLAEYQEAAQSPALAKLFEKWESVAALITNRRQIEPSFLHGDYNPSNIHFPKESGAGLKFVDWEWAGFGDPHADLTSLLKSVSPEIEHQALKLFSDIYVELSLTEHEQLYNRAKAERRLTDAAFLSKQQMNQETAVDWIPGFIERSVDAVLACIEEQSS